MLGKCIRWCQFWMVFLFATLIATTIALSTLILRALISKERSMKIAHWSGILWAKIIFKGMMPWWGIEIIGLKNLLRQGKSSVMISNHQSVADIWSAYFLNFNFVWLSKIEVFKLPLIGPSMKVAGYISIDRKNRRSRVEALEECRKRLQGGQCVFFFPEGTRSKDGSLKKFHLGAFQIAVDEGAPIQPLVLSGTKELFIKGGGIPGKAKVKISVLPIVQPKPGTTKEELRDQCWELMHQELKRLRS